MNLNWNYYSKKGGKPIVVSDSFSPLKQFGHKVQQSIMPIVALADNDLIPLGTGFIVCADGYLITATHVLEEFGKPKVKRRDGDGYYKQFSLYALHITDKKHGENNEQYLGGLWPLHKAHFVPGYDMAICSLQPAEIDGVRYIFPCARLSFEIPTIGQHILGFGYYKSSAKLTNEYQNGSRIADYGQETAFTQGVVTEVFYPQRDSCSITWPSFETTARFESGMSGGPVFNEKGFVCGVICSSIDGLTEKDGYVSYCSLTWPILATIIDTKFSDDGPTVQIPFYEMVKRGFISVDENSFSKVKFRIGSSGERQISVPKP